MSTELGNRAVESLVESLEVPQSSYEAAERRYRDLGQWLNDKEKAKCALFDPQVSPQGSFRLGTAIKPWKRADYDLDLGCKLQTGITPRTHTQKALKDLVGADLETYRRERGIEDKLEEHKRCWRLRYQDSLSFHMDALPAVPHEEDTRRVLQERMIKAGESEALAIDVSGFALAITDKTRPNYIVVSPDWLISNPEGYARWFESRMRQAGESLKKRALMEHVASVDALPVYRWKTPLQRVVQLLKRHRDVMFENNQDGKPISIIITTLAARAYTGQADLYSSLDTVLISMAQLISPISPRVPNPVNPTEDFADKWGTSEGQKLRLEQNFFLWLEQAKADFKHFTKSRDGTLLKEQASQKFGVTLSDSAIAGLLGASEVAVAAPRVQVISSAAKPWHV
ncbi:MAG TPA: nucleotidyltransferase [Hyphomicrobiaceae bacterium]|nr:nucleotidyltransferase [Hyphomicrobiaceae bacterium]